MFIKYFITVLLVYVSLIHAEIVSIDSVTVNDRIKEVTQAEDKIKAILCILKTENEKNLIENLEKRQDRKFDALQKSMNSLEDNMNHTMSKLEPIPGITRNLMEKSTDLEAKIKHVEYYVNRTLKEVETSKADLLKEIRYLRCKRELVHEYVYDKLYLLDSLALDHVLVARNLNIERRYFEMHFAVKTARDAIFLLSPVLKPERYGPKPDNVFEIGIGVGSNKRTELRLQLNSNEVVVLQTPNILSRTEYRNFYIKIVNEKLEFGKEGSNIPLITYDDHRIAGIEYFGFASWENNEAVFLYDCPAVA